MKNLPLLRHIVCDASIRKHSVAFPFCFTFKTSEKNCAMFNSSNQRQQFGASSNKRFSTVTNE